MPHILPLLDHFLRDVADAVIVVDAGARAAYLNPAAERLTGWAATEAMGRPVATVLALQVEPGGPPWPETLVRVLAGDRAQEHADAVLQSRGSGPRRVNLTLYPIPADGDGSGGAAVLLRDISDLYRLREERRIAAMAFETGAPAMVLDVDGRVVRVNGPCSDLSGFSRDELLAMSLETLYAEPDLLTFRNFFASPDPPDMFSARTVRPTKAGDLVSVKEIARKVRDKHDRVTHFVVGFHDLTEMVATTAALAESRHTLAQLMDAMHDGLAVLQKGRIIDCNRQFAVMAGRPREEIIGLDPVAICGPLQPGGKTTGESMAQVMASVGGGGHTLEDWQITRPDGSVGYFEASISRAAVDGRAVLLIAAREVTERLRADREHRRLVEELAARENLMRLSNRAYGIACWEFDPRTRHMRWSDDAEDILGLAPGALDDGLPALKGVIHPEDWPLVTTALEQTGERFSLEVRIRDREGRIRWTHTQAESERDAGGSLAVVRGAVADITERKVAQQTIEQLAFFDPLTGLPNRRLLLSRLAQAVGAARRQRTAGALLFIDLDHFKRINDSLGHSAGDQVLSEVAERLRALTRAEDTVARLGGDEFVVLLNHLGADAGKSAAQAAWDVADRIRMPACRVGDYDYHLSASVGIALFPADGEDTLELLRRADAAMYQAKAEGRRTIFFYQPELQRAADARLAVERDLRTALERDQLALFYQPQMEDGQRVVGAEALLRWHHPQRGLVMPGEFIAIAEETGLIVDIGTWVIDVACSRLAAWNRRGGRGAGLGLSINVSPVQLHHPGLVAAVCSALERHGADPELLTLEITESLLVDRVEAVIDRLRQLAALGVRLSIDDFGTGYSSLSYLRRLPLDEIKIDRSFVSGLAEDRNSAAIVKSMVAIADAFGLQVVAEGVETEAEARFLRRLGCRRQQGYLYSRPLPASEFAELLQRPPRRASG